MTPFDPDKITFFAKTDARGKNVNFGIRAADRQRHMYVVGKTGMGKSTLLENMAAQDIQNGEGLAFIDPHGSAAETLLEYVPEHRVKDVVYFAPFDLDNPIAFNVMEDVGADTRHLVVSGLMSTFKKIWVDAWSARMEYILTNALLALIEYPDTTLLSVNRLFSDKGYRKKVVEYIKDPAVKSFWVDEYAGYTERFTAEALPAIQNKIGQFTGNPLIRNIIGQPHSSFDIREMMDNKKILIINLSKGLIGETNANLLGSMLTTRIYLAAMSRANLPVAEMRQMPNFYFYVDEFQSFANATFANILSEARKYHLNLIIAHQYIEQMEEDVRNAVFGNVGTTIAFRVGPFDAEVLETVFSPRFEAADLVNLGFAQIYLTLMIQGIGSQPFSATTLPPVELPDISCRESVVSSSRTQYAKPRSEIEGLVAELHTPTVEVKPKKNNDKRSNGSNGNSNHNQGKPAPGRPRYEQSDKTKSELVQRKPYSPPASQQKTPDDLRQILAKMNKSDVAPVKNNSVGVKVAGEDVKQSKKQDKPKDSNHKLASGKPRYDQSDKPKTLSVQAKTYDRPASQQKTPDDLRQILAKMNKSDAAPVKNNSVGVKVAGEDVKQSGKYVEPKGDDRSRSALANVLKRVEVDTQPASVRSSILSSSPSSISSPESVPKDVRLKEVPDKPEVPTSLEKTMQKPPVGKSAIRKVLVEHRRNNSVPDESNSSTFAPKNLRRNNDSELDVAEIKRLLRKSDSEKSPFN